MTLPQTAKVRDLALDFGLPVLVFALALGFWEGAVWFYDVPPYLLPPPSLIGATLVRDWPVLAPALLVTLGTTFAALLAAIVGGVSLAILFLQWRWLERALFPFAVILQVTPVVAIAPLLIIYLSAPAAELASAFLVAFFPILANSLLGLASTDHHLVDLFQLSRASRWQTLIHLRLPSALPYFLGGLRISGGLALIGAIVAELVAGKPGAGAGLAYRIVEAGFRSNIPRMFAAVTLICLSGIAIFLLFTALSHLLLRHWHESARAH